MATHKEDDLQKAINAKKDARVKRCFDKVQKALKEENCNMTAEIILTDGLMPKSRIVINPKD